MNKIKPDKWLATCGIASLIALMLLLRSGEQALARINGVAMVTTRILNVPGLVLGQPLPITESMAADEANYFVA